MRMTSLNLKQGMEGMICLQKYQHNIFEIIPAEQSTLMESGYTIEEINYQDTKPLILDVHYAHRMPSIQKSFGMFKDGELVGVCTYGIPPSHTLLKGVCGEEFKKDVIELNRLVLKYNRKNEASQLVGKTLKKLGNKIVVSYADGAQDHLGIVYQATNFTYTGQTKPIKEIYLKSRPHLHHTTFRGKTYKQMEEEHGDDVGYRLRSIKHRYVHFVGDKRFKKLARKALRYKVSPYPKNVKPI